jgi:transposase
MIYAQVNDENLKLLRKELKTTKDAKWYRRLKIIQLSSQCEKVPQLAKQLDVCQATVRDYIKRYNSGGLETLKPDKSSGRPPTTQLTKAEWEELLHRSPCQFSEPRQDRILGYIGLLWADGVEEARGMDTARMTITI